MITALEIYNEINRDGIYYTILDGIIYYNNHHDNTTWAIKNKRHIQIFNDTCLSHNFRPFKFKEKYFGIGGQDNWKVDKKWRGLSYDQFVIEYKNHFHKEYGRGKDFYQEIKYRFDTTPTRPHNQGLYLLTSDDGLRWKFVSNEPIITALFNGFNNALEWKSAEFDAMPEVVRFKDKWFIYLRNNIGEDRRDIQVSTSNNLLKWNKFKQIKHDYDIKKDNYYHPVMFEHRKKLFGFFNYYNKEKSCIKIKLSEDGYKWKEITEMFVEFPHIMENGKTKLKSIVCSVKKTDYNIFFWINHFYNNNDMMHNSYLAKYKITMDDFNGLS